MKKLVMCAVAAAFALAFTAGAEAAEKKAAPAKAEAKKEAKSSAAVLYWKDWTEGTAKGLVPPCGTNVLALGGDDILQATVEAYCAVKPGQYVSYINPKVMDHYKKKSKSYPDGQIGVLAFPEIGVAFTTDIKGGKPIYDAVSMKDGKSVASNEPNHPLNPKTCEKCHASFKGVCRGFVCGNRM